MRKSSKDPSLVEDVGLQEREHFPFALERLHTRKTKLFRGDTWMGRPGMAM